MKKVLASLFVVASLAVVPAHAADPVPAIYQPLTVADSSVVDPSMGLAIPPVVAQPALVADSAATPALPGPDPNDLGALVGLVTELIAAVQAGNYELAVAAGLMILVFVYKKWVHKSFPKEQLKWIAVGVAVAVQVATALKAGGDWTSALAQGFGTGLMSIGMWQLAGDPVTKKLGWKPTTKP
ncbi:MAG TPA: hypothetical protein VEA38_19220 [Terriglobales bacterium]|nr:hypothetical protein [Terriglobales bacterium]